MAILLVNTSISHYLQQVISNASEKLILISPYLRMSLPVKQALEDRDRMKIDIRLVYRENQLKTDEQNWLKSLKFIRLSSCPNLHAKCYLNESEAIITSMNLVEFSQVNNVEMGIYVDKKADTDLYDNIYKEAMKLVRISDDSIKVITPNVKIEVKEEIEVPVNLSGFCIRCHAEKPLNPKEPYCPKCWSSQKRKHKKFKEIEHEENYCHLCGKQYKTSLNLPLCPECQAASKD